MIKIKNKIKNFLNPTSEAINEDLDYFKIDLIRLFKNFNSQMSKAPGMSISSALQDVFINNQNSNNDNNGENLFI